MTFTQDNLSTVAVCAMCHNAVELSEHTAFCINCLGFITAAVMHSPAMRSALRSVVPQGDVGPMGARGPKGDVGTPGIQGRDGEGLSSQTIHEFEIALERLNLALDHAEPSVLAKLRTSVDAMHDRVWAIEDDEGPVS